MVATSTTEPPVTADVATIAKGLKLLMKSGGVHELRSPPGRQYGMFTDPLLMAESAKKLSDCKAVSAVYWSLNPLFDDLLERSPNHLSPSAKGQSAGDTDIICRHLMLVDLDPVRPADCSSTDDEKAKAWNVGERVRSFLHSRGYPDPIVADSGNGFHLLYRINLPAHDGGIVKRILQGLAARFDTPHVKVDQSVYNPSRITKLYGTVTRKGPHTAERPHRVSKVLEGDE